MAPGSWCRRKTKISLPVCAAFGLIPIGRPFWCIMHDSCVRSMCEIHMWDSCMGNSYGRLVSELSTPNDFFLSFLPFTHRSNHRLFDSFQISNSSHLTILHKFSLSFNWNFILEVGNLGALWLEVRSLWGSWFQLCLNVKFCQNWKLSQNLPITSLIESWTCKVLNRLSSMVGIVWPRTERSNFAMHPKRPDEYFRRK